MKKPKRINSKRPSLWMDLNGAVRVFYPNGRVEHYRTCVGWSWSVASDSNPELAIQNLRLYHTFLGYL